MMRSKNTFNITSGFGILFLLVGFVYIFFMLYEKDKKVTLKEEKLNAIQEKLDEKKLRLELKDALIKKIDHQILQSKDSILINTAQNEIITNKHFETTITKRSSRVDCIDETPTIYIQVGGQITEQHLETIKLMPLLNNRGCNTFGYEIVGNIADNTIRYFHTLDKELAQSIKEQLKIELGLELDLIKIEGYGNKAPVQQIELWIK